MRGTLTDQDLTNYALNDGLDDRERLYVESMLAISEECRQDVYAMLDVAQMLEEGFDRENSRAADELTLVQREKLLHPPRRHPALAFLQKASAAVALAACVAFALVHPELWQGAAAHRVASVSTTVTKMVTNASNRGMQANTEDFAQYVDFQPLVDDSAAWLQQASDSLPQSGTICTPPSWPDSTDFGSLR
jgi:anti-sigma factor RsiW